MDWEVQKQHPASHRISRRQRAVRVMRVFPPPYPKAAATWCCGEPLGSGWHMLAARCSPRPQWNTSALRALRRFAGRKAGASISVSSHTQLPEYWATPLCTMAEWMWHFLGQASTACSRHTEQPWAALLSLNSSELKGICQGDLNLISSLTQSCYFS